MSATTWQSIRAHSTAVREPPITLDEMRARVAGRWGVVESTKVEGNMAFLVVRHAG